MDQERLDILLQKHLDEVLTPEERHELGQTLLESPRAREHFWEVAKWNATLREWGMQSWGQEPPEIPTTPPPRNLGSRSLRWLALAATIALLCGAAYYFLRPPSASMADPLGELASEEEPASDGVAVLTLATEVVWTDLDSQRQMGKVLTPGWLRFKSGALQVEFSRGARVVIEGPAEFELISHSEAFLKSGKLRASVPEAAQGFRIRSAGFELLDHGTEFGCFVPETGAPEIHVFQGEVEVQPEAKSEASRSLYTQQAVRVVDDKQLSVITARPDFFLTEEELNRRQTERTTRELEHWRQLSESIAAMPDVLWHLDFERRSTWKRTMQNRVPQSQPSAEAGVVGSDWVAGRWPDKGALEFKRSDDRVRLNIPGKHDHLTLTAWVRVDSLPHKQHALLMGESFAPGEVHWYVYKDGSLGFGMRAENPAERDYTGWKSFHSSPIILPETLGTWTHLVSVVDGRSGYCNHYCNGIRVGTSNSNYKTKTVKLELGHCEIGNWGVRPSDPQWADVKLRGANDATRNLHGRIDEMTIFSRALTEEEIRKLYEQGRPKEGSPAAGS
jgi:hypothetical protein